MRVSLGADAVLNTAVTHTFSTPGTHIGAFTLTADRLTFDDRRYFVLDALGAVRVLCVGEQTASAYLALALNPNPDTGAPIREGGADAARTQTAGVMILPTQCTPTEFETLPLEDYDVILLADVGTFSARMDARLHEFRQQAKSVILFVSERADAAQYNRTPWSPAQLGERLTWAPPEQVQSYQEAHPIFDVFPNEGFSADYTPRFYSGIALQPAPDANVVARFSDGTPFLVERRSGGATVLLYNCGLHQQETDSTTRTASNDLLVNPYFLPMLQQSVLYATAGDPQRFAQDRLVGDTYTAHYPQHAGGTATVRFMADGDHTDTADTADTLEADTGDPSAFATVVPIAEDGTLRFHDTERPGIYQVEVRTRARTERSVFAVNLDTAESDLSAIPLADAAAQIGAETDAETPAADTADTYDARRRGREIWGELLLFGVSLLLLESYLSNRETAGTAGDT